jgi:TonB-dependent SusC/RagA subfamily outer membrane receptor
MPSIFPRLSRAAWALTCVAGTATFVRAQAPATGTVSGTVTDVGTSQPLGDVRVFIAGSTLGTQTNARGEFRLAGVPAGRAQVNALRIGYKTMSDTVRLTAGGTATLTFRMSPSLTTLSEVVVTGTVGNQERRAQAAQVSSLQASDVKANAAITTVNELLQSRLPSVSVASSSGSAGTSKQIRIRGASSLSLSNQPLVFVDGVRISEGVGGPFGTGGQSSDRINDLNPDDIESIEVVKGPAAATLYGADASTGVIQIITKKGRTGVNGFQQTVRSELGSVDQNFSTPANYANCTAALVAPTSLNPLCRGQAVGALVSDNPLMREGGFRKGSDVLLGWTGRGGGQSYGYFLSLNSDRNIGTLPNNEFQRQSVRTNFNFVPSSKVTVDANLQVLRSKTFLPDNDNNIFGYLGGSELGSPLSVVDTGGTIRGGWFGGVTRNRDAISAIQNNIETRRSLLSTTASYIPYTWWRNRLTLGGDILTDETTRFFPKNTLVQYGGLLDGGSNGQGRIGQQRYTVDYVADLSHQFRGNIQANLSLGAQVIATRFDSLGSTGVTFASNTSNVISSASTTSGGQSRNETRQVGYLGQLQIGWADRRFIQVGARVDDFSAFGANTDPIVLPKVGGSWVVSEEGFFEPAQRILPTLRLRAAYGTTGRAPTAGAALQTLQPSPYAITANPAGTGATSSAGAVPLNPGNAGLKPEKGSEIEAGFDATVFTDRVSLEVTYFNKVSQDVLLQRTLPPSLGFQQNPFVNIGEIRNRGFEFALNGQLLKLSQLQWDSRVNFNTLDLELTDLGGIAPFGTLNRFTEGYQPGAFVSKRIRSVDVAANRVVVSDTFEVVGNVLPSFEAGWNNTFTLFKDLRINTLVDTKRGFYLYNLSDFFRETQLVRSNRRLDPAILTAEEKLRRYGDQTAGRPAFVQENGTGTTVNEARDPYIQKGDFVRFRELGFTYTVPSSLLRTVRALDGATIGLAFQNLALWSDYEGPDPEVVSFSTNTGVNQFSRQDFLTLPNPKRTLLRFNLSF